MENLQIPNLLSSDSLCTGMIRGTKFTHLRIQVFSGVMLCHWVNGSQHLKHCGPVKTMGTNNPTAQCHIPEDLNPQQHQYENLKSHSFIFSYIVCVFLLFFTEHGKKSEAGNEKNEEQLLYLSRVPNSP